MAIYTKRGDKGETSVYDEGSAQRTRVSKDSLRVEALGAIDELNSFLGVCASFSENPSLTKILKEIQANLLTIGSITAGSNLKFSKAKTNRLEKLIDDLEGKLPVLANFVVPGGTKLASHLQYARALVRRTERRVVALSKEQKINPAILKYLNRLSDSLFMLAREANNNAGVMDEVWIGKKR